MRISGIVWLGIAVGLVIVIATARAVRTKTGARRLDVGSVSDQWVAEHRVASGDRVSH